MAIMYLSIFFFTVPKQKISLFLTMLKQYINACENSMKPDINSIIAQKAVPHAINIHVLSDKNPCINQAIHMLLMHSFVLYIYTF